MDAAVRLTRQTDSLSAKQLDRDQQDLLVYLHNVHERLVVTLSATPGLSGRGTEGLQYISGRIDTMRVITRLLMRRNEDLIAARLSAAEEVAQQAGEFAVVLTFGAIVMTILLSILLARTITSPIRALQAGAARIARGSFEPITVRSNDETADLARSFNAMSDKLREVNEYRAEMMHHITHELRTPLQSLHSIYYLMSEQIAGPLNEKQRKYMETLRVNAERIGAFTNMYLDLAKFEAGKMIFHRSPVDLRTLVDGPVESARVAAAQHKITLDVEKEEIPPVEVDPEKTIQVITNLLSNAVKYTPDGGTVMLKLSATGTRVRMTVTDTGVGIDPEDVPHLFTKFYQAKNSDKARSKGTGLGLALVQAIVEGQNGTIRVESALDIGTTFTVEFPVAADGSQAGKKAGAA
jgi:signal transduction histidine kinase